MRQCCSAHSGRATPGAKVDADDVGRYYSDRCGMGDLLVGVEIAHPMLYKFVKSKKDSEVEIHAWICGAHAQLLYCY